MKKLLYIDLFCGAGGTSTGVENAVCDGEKCAQVIACVNHDKNAIASHAANHPHALHFTEDIRTLDLTQLVEHTKRKKEECPGSLVVLWASLECTNFSNAKGGQPRDADSRTLAEHLFRYIEAISPDYIQIENVREFMYWGDLDENGRPVSKDKGRCYVKWVKKVCSYGYDFDHRILNAANYGAYTSRERFFGVFAKKGLPIAWPEATHSKNGVADLFSEMGKWKPVKEVLDLDDIGKSIFRDKPLSERTLERIYAGLVKFSSHDVDSFLSKQYGGDPEGKNISTEGPAGTITCIDHHALVTKCMKEQFVDYQYGNGKPGSIMAPAGTITTKPKLQLVTAKSAYQFLMNPQFQSKGASVDKPCFTLIARMDKKPPYIVSAQSGNKVEVHDGDSPMTIKIKEFMAEHGISDVCIRMLKIVELKRIMGFDDSYQLVGTQTEQKKFIGNAVEVNMSRVLCEALCKAIKNKQC